MELWGDIMVLVYSDDKKVALEILSKATELAKEIGSKVTVAVMPPFDDAFVQDLFKHGADKVVKASIANDKFRAEEHAQALAEVSKELGPKMIMVGSTRNGKELAPRLAIKLGTGCVTDCTNVMLQDGTVTTERIVYSGNAVAVESFKGGTAIVTIPPKLYDPLPAEDGRTGEVVDKTIEVAKANGEITNVSEVQSTGVNVVDAEVIVSCGRGLKDKGDLKLIDDLASVLKGVAIGCSRPIAADLKWLPEEQWVGLSGKKVKPKLYVAVGISGQIQHIAGMRDSGIIVAINKDPEALMFKSADYGIVGDLYQILPKLTEGIKDR